MSVRVDSHTFLHSIHLAKMYDRSQPQRHQIEARGDLLQRLPGTSKAFSATVHMPHALSAQESPNFRSFGLGDMNLELRQSKLFHMSLSWLRLLDCVTLPGIVDNSRY